MQKIIIILILIVPKILLGQDKGISINISVFNESTAIPFTQFVTTPIHPGIQIGSEINYKLRERSRIFQTANINYFYHNHLAQGIGFNTEFGYEYRMKFGLAFEGLIGVGYMHTFVTAEEFTFANGQYEKRPDKGNSRFYPSISLDVGYYLKKEDRTSPKIFIRYQSWAEYPYSGDFIPVMAHINLHLGVKLFIKSKQ